MSARTGPRALGLVIAVVIAMLVTACGGTSPTAPRVSPHPSTSAPALTAGDLAWIKAITELHKKVDEPFMAGSINMTKAKMYELAGSLRSCKRELSRLGPPGTLLQPAYELAVKACRTYAKGAKCFMKAASVSDAAGATVAGTPEERIQRRASACGFAAEGNGSNLMAETEAKAAAIQAQYP